MRFATMTYYHKQFFPLCVLPYLIGLSCFFMACLFRNGPAPVPFLLSFNGLLFSLIGAFRHHMTVVDEGDQLAVSFGPLTTLKKRVRYDKIKAVELAKISFRDGSGINLSLRGGLACNPSARDCVVIRLKNGFIRIIRIGTNDAENLVHFSCTVPRGVCLREEEWLDAEDEFERVIRTGLQEARSERPAERT
jgi:hypothetical protein